MTSKQLGWLGVLNALAGTQNLGQLACANKLAGTTGESLIGALNIWAGNGSDPKNWVGLNLVCNQIAGTHNLEALQALQIKAGLT